MEPSTRPQRTSFLIGSIASILYFSEGLPFGIVTDLLPVYLRVEHVPLISIGFLSTVGSAWTLKVFWSPLIDTIGSYRRWISAAVLTMAVAMATLAALHGALGRNFWILITLLALASATQDLAVDAFTIRATPSRMVGPVNSIRVMAYRIAIIVGGGGLAALADRVGWPGTFAVAAALLSVIFVITLFLPDDRGSSASDTGRPSLIDGLRHWMSRPRAGTLLAIVFLYRLGELAIVSMIKPYWVDRGYSASEIGTITTVIGVSVSVAGAIAGGAFVARFGLYKSLLWLGLAQITSNLGYAIVATIGAGRWGIYVAAILENFGYGLGTAAFLAFLMSICDRSRAATEYAMLTAAFGLSRMVMGTASGFIAQNAGYAAYFWLAVFLGIPGLLLVVLVREQLQPRALPMTDAPALGDAT